MKALSIRQPWAWEIVQGIKVVEFRTWSIKYEGRFFIHASKTIEKDRLTGEKSWLERYGKDLPEDWSIGGIVGIATLVECVQRVEPSLWRRVYDAIDRDRPPPGTVPRPDSKWFKGSYGFILADVRPLQFEPYRGQLGFFNVPDDLYGPELEI